MTPLFKQSIKANWISWLVVSVATCFMLALIMAVVGSDNVNNVMKHLGDSIADEAIESQIEETSMSYYYVLGSSLEGYEFAQPTEDEKPYIIAGILENAPQELKGSLEGALNGYANATDVSLTDYATDYTVLAVKEMLSQPLAEYGFTGDKIAEIAADAIISFRAHLDVKFPAQPMMQIDSAEAMALVSKLSESLMDSFPENVKDNIADMQTLDITQLMTGSIFFKIAGILLAVIYIIMVSNSLIAGQVDSGSMAYILSTPIKRKTVTITQMLFMLTAVLGLCLMTCATGILSIAFLGGTSISYVEMLLLNLGYFLTLFAFSGICFFASAWFNRSKHSMAIGGGVSMYFIVATILGLFGSPAMPGLVRMDSMNIFNFTTITYLFDTDSILGGSSAFIWKFSLLAVIGIVGFVVGIIKFNKKDLPL